MLAWNSRQGAATSACASQVIAQMIRETSATEGGKLAPKYAVCVCQVVGSGQSHHTVNAVYRASARAISEAGGGEGCRSGPRSIAEPLPGEGLGGQAA